MMRFRAGSQLEHTRRKAMARFADFLHDAPSTLYAPPPISDYRLSAAARHSHGLTQYRESISIPPGMRSDASRDQQNTAQTEYALPRSTRRNFPKGTLDQEKIPTDNILRLRAMRRSGTGTPHAVAPVHPGRVG